MGRSVERDGVFGKYTEHFDDAGNKLGESRERDGVFGKYVEHTDADGNKVGESRDVSGFFGDYTEHRDAYGDKSGESRHREGVFGDYTEHVDAEGRKVGESRERHGFFGDYTENTGATWSGGGRQSYSRPSYSYSGGGGGESNWILWLVGIMFGLTLLAVALVIAVPIALVVLGGYLIVKKSNPWVRAGGAAIIVVTVTGVGFAIMSARNSDTSRQAVSVQTRPRAVAVGTESRSVDPGSTAAKLGLAGSWSGTQNNSKTSLVINGGSGDDFNGVKTQGSFQVAFTGHIDPSTRQVTIQETRIIKSASGWSLGTETGRLSADGRTLSGTGQDENTSYTWSYSKR